MELKNGIIKLRLYYFIIVIISLFFFPKLTFANTAPVTRLAGPDRYATAAAIAEQGWPQADYCLLASGENYPDALSAVPLAQKYDAPILLTKSTNLPEVTKQALVKLQVKNVIIIGGTGVIPASIENELQSMQLTSTRISGQDRYQTSLQIAQQFADPAELVVTTGEDYPDALSIAPIAGQKQIPIILVPQNNLPEAVKNYIAHLNLTKTIVIGDSSVVADSVYNQLPNPERIGGADKYQRNVAINKAFGSDFNSGNVCLATGQGFADALTGAAYAAKISAPIILVSNPLAADTKGYYQELLPSEKNIYIFGGTGVVSDDLVQDLDSSTTNSSPAAAQALSGHEIAQLLKPSIVYIETFDSEGNTIGTASGVIATADGKIFTNYHVIAGAASAKVTLEDGTKLDVTGVAGYDEKNDAVVLNVTANNLQPAVFNSSSTAQIGDKIYTIGNPFGLEDTISDGLISTVDRVIEGETYIQISAPISPGSSGGALINEQGEVIGITADGLSGSGAQNINFAIPIEAFKAIKDQDLGKSLESISSQQTTVPTSSLANPVSLNNPQTITVNGYGTNYTAEITVEQIVRGAQALTMVENADKANDAPKPGYEYLAAKINFKLSDIDGGKSLNLLGELDFNLVSQNGLVYNPVLEVEPYPQFDARLYKGASTEGWVVFIVKPDDTMPEISYGIQSDGTGGIWFKAYDK